MPIPCNNYNFARVKPIQPKPIELREQTLCTKMTAATTITTPTKTVIEKSIEGIVCFCRLQSSNCSGLLSFSAHIFHGCYVCMSIKQQNDRSIYPPPASRVHKSFQLICNGDFVGRRKVTHMFLLRVRCWPRWRSKLTWYTTLCCINVTIIMNAYSIK